MHLHDKFGCFSPSFKQKIVLIWALTIILFYFLNNQHLRVNFFQNEKEAQRQGYSKE